MFYITATTSNNNTGSEGGTHSKTAKNDSSYAGRIGKSYSTQTQAETTAAFNRARTKTDRQLAELRNV